MARGVTRLDEFCSFVFSLSWCDVTWRVYLLFFSVQIISLAGWVNIMYYVQDAHSFWDWIYFTALIVVSWILDTLHASYTRDWFISFCFVNPFLVRTLWLQQTSLERERRTKDSENVLGLFSCTHESHFDQLYYYFIVVFFNLLSCIRVLLIFMLTSVH